MSEEPRVIARVFGGLGNQLFCYAAARRLALANGVPLRLDVSSGFAHDGYRRQYLLDRFAIPCDQATAWASYMHPGGRLRRRAAALINRNLPLHQRWYVQEKTSHHFDPQLLTLTVSRPVYVTGYWQSEKYFADVAAVIRSDLTWSAPHGAKCVSLAAQIQDTESVSIHLRSFAEVKRTASRSVWNTPLPLEYYTTAARRLADIVGSPAFYCFSDNVEWARGYLRLPWPVVHVHTNAGRGYAGAVDDLWLMSRCQHHIVSNSTFSWWGAWLGDHEDRVTVVPDAATKCDPDWAPTRWSIV